MTFNFKDNFSPCTYIDEQSDENQQGGQIHCDGRLEEERLEVVGGVAYDCQQDGWDVRGEHDCQQSPAKNNVDLWVDLLNFFSF